MDRKLPSRFTFGDIVSISFADSGLVKNAEIIKVHFTPSKVFYDVDVKFHYAKQSELGSAPDVTEYWNDDEHAGYARLYNIDSAFVVPQD